MLSHAQVQQFKIDGYLVLPNWLNQATLDLLSGITLADLDNRVQPYELEADLHYPGAPKSPDTTGGNTIRRLRDAFQRHREFRNIAGNQRLVNGIAQILNTNRVHLNLCHHNCVMTKQPEFSSDTLWHRDTRYWHFSDKYLINAWFALGQEYQQNGAMKILPGSHRWEVQENTLDDAQFLISDHPDNQDRIQSQRIIELNAGDMVLFSAHCFHAAGRNTTTHSKYSIVFTYHGEQTHPIAKTHSDSVEEIIFTVS